MPGVRPPSPGVPNAFPRRREAHGPSHTAYVVRNIGEKSYFDRIGAAWENADGNGFTIRLNALPLTGEIVIRKPKSDENGGAQ